MFMKKLLDLLNIKTIITIMLTAVFCYLALTGKIDSDKVSSITTTIICFYFGIQYEKKSNNRDDDDSKKGGK